MIMTISEGRRWMRPMVCLRTMVCRRTMACLPATACLLAGAVMIFAGLLAPSGQALAQGAVKSVYGDWQIRCDTPPGAQKEQCALVQSVTAEDRPNVALTVLVLKTADKMDKLGNKGALAEIAISRWPSRQ